MDGYENWFGSPFYKILYHNRDDKEAQEFIEKLLRFLKPASGCAMLDIACGEGRHAKQLAEHGFEVTGIDLSDDCIEAAKAFEQANLQFFVQDMRMPVKIDFYDYAFNFFTSFGYFKEESSHKMAADSFAGCLKTEGVLVIDYFNSRFIMNNLVQDSIIERGEYQFNICKKVEHNHIIKNISFTDENARQRSYTEAVAIFSLSDFIQMFGNAGMELTSTFGDYKLNPYDEITSPRMIMIFKKK